jgi:signal transduction histidine kinase/HPt (histidine-containing phosphotransfer) domain-containing protein
MVVIGGVVAGLLVPLTAATIYSGETEAKRLVGEAKGAHERLTQVVAIGVQKALWDLAPEGAQPLVASAMGDTRVVRTSILDAQGQVFHEAKDDSRRVGEVVTLEKPVSNGDQVIGKVVVEFSLADAAASVRQHLIETLVVAGIQAAVCILILVLLLNRRVLARVERLKTQAQRLAAKQLDEPFVWTANDEIGELGSALETTRQSLRGLFQNLEGLVAERTATIKMILDNVRSGFLLIDGSQTVQPGYSLSCERLFAKNGLAGHKLIEALGLAAGAGEHFELCVAQVFDDFLPEEVSLEQIPRRAKVGDRTLAVEGSTVRKADGSVGSILLTVTDVTDLEKVEGENRQNRALIRILQNLAAFREFVKETRGRLADARAALDRGDEVVVRRELHTLKGNLAAFGLEELAAQVHHIEDQSAIAAGDIAALTDAVKQFLAARRDMLGVRFSEGGAESVAVANEAFEQLERVAAGTPGVLQWIHDVRKVTVQSMMGPMADYLERVAEARGKIVKFEVIGGNTRVDGEIFKPIITNLIHLLRNSVDHGIEPAVDRGAKDAVGRLTLRFTEAGGKLEIRVQDDGRGIDAEKVKASAVRNGRMTAEAAARLGAEQALDLIFLDGLSTAEAVSEISGRGVGMSAVREAVLALGGSMKVSTTLGVGTEIRIVVPVPEMQAQALRKAG